MPTAKELAIVCARGAHEYKAEDIRIIDVRGISSLTDYCVICTATSTPHLRALIRDIENYAITNADIHPQYKDGNPHSNWGVLDYIDVMVHIMNQETREFYGLEEIWKNAAEVAWEPVS